MQTLASAWLCPYGKPSQLIGAANKRRQAVVLSMARVMVWLLDADR